ncbi:MAG: hypothetical protein BAJALOKI1v1_120003 [Promethearchaeota archaeon]|nr:MAG: hypothetical protein BAJALOKI1v1_120003 [Candidatus Lokiarchaeota archaeon]
MYCSNCNKEVQVKREDINWAILVLLTIFTAGIGVLIYLSVYFRKPMNRCIHCNSLCYSTFNALASNKLRNSETIPAAGSSGQVLTTIKKTALKEDDSQSRKELKYCTNCGLEIDDRGKLNFCAYCGFQLH